LLPEFNHGSSITIGMTSRESYQTIARPKSAVPDFLKQPSMQRMERAAQCLLRLDYLVWLSWGSNFRWRSIRVVRTRGWICSPITNREKERIFIHG
jgi:hypothetical protein